MTQQGPPPYKEGWLLSAKGSKQVEYHLVNISAPLHVLIGFLSTVNLFLVTNTCLFEMCLSTHIQIHCYFQSEGPTRGHLPQVFQF